MVARLVLRTAALSVAKLVHGIAETKVDMSAMKMAEMMALILVGLTAV